MINIFGPIKEIAAEYIDVYVRLFRISLIRRTSAMFSYMLFALIGIFILFCVILFLGFGLVEFLADSGLSKTASSFIVVGIYFLLLVLLFVCRKPITRFFSGGIIRAMTEGDNEDDND